eukprot:COSAG02_NODE_988_length_15440_cov_5.979271_11_plen_236_part_00
MTHLTEAKTKTSGQTFGEDCLCDLFEDRVAIAKDPYRRRDTTTVIDDCELRFWTLIDLYAICERFPSLRHELWLLHMLSTTKRQKAIAHSWEDNQDGQKISDSTVDIAERMKLKLSASKRNAGKRNALLPPLPNAPSPSGGEMVDAESDAKMEKAQSEKRMRELEKNISIMVGKEVDQVTARIDELAKTLTAVAESLNVTSTQQPDPVPSTSGDDKQAENETRRRTRSRQLVRLP